MSWGLDVTVDPDADRVIVEVKAVGFRRQVRDVLAVEGRPYRGRSSQSPRPFGRLMAGAIA